MTRLYLFLFSLFISSLWLHADDSAAEHLKHLSGEDAQMSDWQWAARHSADKQLRNDIRTSLLERKTYPRKELVALLNDPQLAVRLGALELLEEAAGDHYGFNPWASPTGKKADPNNVEALQLWNKWAGGKGEIKASNSVLSDEQMQSYIRDIVSQNPERKRRATRMLEPHGLKGVTAIQTFLLKNPSLPTSARLNLKEAQYHLVLSGSAGENASILARDLTYGNRDQQLSALATLKKSGLLAIPIVRDFLGSDDALVRETAVDTILSLGNEQTVPLVIPFLKKEKDVNVIHAALRRFREIGGKQVRDAVAEYLDNDDEDLIVSAIKTLTKLCKSEDIFSSSKLKSKTTPEINAKIATRLSDPRWRVRAAALEYVAKTREHVADDKVIDLLSDKDEFVRAQAIQATVELSLKKAKAHLLEMFLKDDDMIAPATKALTGMGIVLPPKLIAHLDTRDPDVIVGALKSLSSSKKPFLEVVARYATHKNLDVSCAALRELGDDSDKVKHEFVANHLASALQSGVDAKIDAVLVNLRLPSSSRSYTSTFSDINQPSQPGTSLDPLYNAFIAPNKTNANEATPEVVHIKPAEKPKVEGGLKALKDAVAVFVSDWEKNPERAFKASLLLAKIEDDRGIKSLKNRLPKLSVSERAAIADNLYNATSKEVIPLLQGLIQDEISDVRKEAFSRAINHESNLPLIKMAFEQIDAPNTRLQIWETYSYNLESLTNDRNSKRFIRTWCRDVLNNTKSKDSKIILALLMMRQAMSKSDLALLEPFTKNASQWVRRAAWYSLCRYRPTWVSDRLDNLTSDQSPKVRLVLPKALNHKYSIWNHYFSDTKKEPLRSWSSSTNRFKLNEKITKSLRKMAESDPSAEVRFEAWFALLAYGKPIDINAFIKLIPQQSKESKSGDRLAKYLEGNYTRMGMGMKPLLAYANLRAISKSKLPRIIKHFTPAGSDAGFTSFQSLAKTTETSGEQKLIKPAVDTEKLIAQRKRLHVIVFYKAGCKECEKVERFIESIKRNFPLMSVTRRNINNPQDTLVNQALCDRLGVDGAGKAPAVFTQAGGLVAPATRPEAIVKLIQDTMELPDNSRWDSFGKEEIVIAEKHVEETFSKMTFTIVVLAGLVDGINPCAFATIIFFLSYLQIARRSPREILMVGTSFILAVFVAYFSIGLAFNGLVTWLNEQSTFLWIKWGMTYLFAGFALLVAILSLRDGFKALPGNLHDMTLQLPEFLKLRIRGVIRKGAKSKSFVIAAFVSGIIISFLELACTGQVYAPIIFKIHQGSTDAILYLLYYNLAFITPLIIIFILAYRGMTSEALIRFQKNHTALVKFATAILFFVLTAIILFGDKWFK